MRAEIFGLLQQLQFEVTRKDFNTAALQCEMHLSSPLEQQAQVAKLLELRSWQVCFSGWVCSPYICCVYLSVFFLLLLFLLPRTLSLGIGNCDIFLFFFLLFKRVLFWLGCVYSTIQHHSVGLWVDCGLEKAQKN